VDVKACVNCRGLAYRRLQTRIDQTTVYPVVALYAEIVRVKNVVEELMPGFTASLFALRYFVLANFKK
jgi:hypothetical protein